nr:hypothetical protein [Tanacetum cinerariifolium]
VENMDANRDEGKREVIVGEPFCKASYVEERRFDGMITIFNGVVEQISKVLEILDSIKIPNVDTDRLRVHVFPFSLTGAARKWWINGGSEKSSPRQDLLGRRIIHKVKHETKYEESVSAGISGDRYAVFNLSEYEIFVVSCEVQEQICRIFLDGYGV